MRRVLTVTVSVLVLTGAVRSPAPQAVTFDVTSVKPNGSGDDSVSMAPSPGGIAWTNATLQMMMRQAYRVQDFQIIGGPDWLTTARFDVTGRVVSNESRDELPLASMLQALLEDRFRLTVHHETRELAVYALVAVNTGGRFGPHLRRPSNCVTPVAQQTARPEEAARLASLPTCTVKVLPGDMSGRGVTMRAITGSLSVFTGRTVVDRTGLTDMFDFELLWTPDLTARDGAPAGAATDANRPSLSTALQEQLGLKLESTRAPVDVLVIDHVERPTPD